MGSARELVLQQRVDRAIALIETALDGRTLDHEDAVAVLVRVAAVLLPGWTDPRGVGRG